MTEGSGFVRPRRGDGGNPLLEMPELLDAALAEFSRRSFDAASLNDILKAAGLNKGSFYYRFSGKLDLYLCMCDVIIRKKMELFAQMRTGPGALDDFFTQLRAMVAAGLEFARREPYLHALSRRFLAEPPAVRKAIRDAFPAVSQDALQPLLDAARARGQFRERFSDRFIRALVEILPSSLEVMVTSETSDEEMREILDQAIDLLQGGLAAAPAGAPAERVGPPTARAVGPRSGE
jgi:TetR/AcrR family transcriptional regulator